MLEVGLVLLGSVLGVGGTLIAFHVTREYRRKEFKRSLGVEFKELRYKVACDGYLLRIKACTLTREFLDWQNQILDDYEGPHRRAEVDEGRKAFDNLDDEKLKILCEIDRRQQLEKDGGLERSEIPQKIELPLLEADVKPLSLFPAEYQKVVLDIKTRIRWFNQGVDGLERNDNRMVDTTLSAENVAVVRLNMHEAYVKMADLSFELGKRIGKFLEKY